MIRLLLSKMYFHSRSLSKKSKGSTTKFFGTLRLKSFDGKSWYPSIMHKVFRYTKFSETLKVSRRKLRNCERKSWWRKNLTPLLFSTIESFLKNWSSHHDFFSLQSEKKAFDETLIHLISNFLSEPEHFRVTMVQLRILSVLWDKKKFARKLGYPPLLSENFFLL